MEFSEDQFEAPLHDDPDALVADIIEHLQEHLPFVIESYPPGYLIGIVRDSIRIGQGFGITDVVGLRTFTDLRWRMAAGWFNEPRLAGVLRMPGLSSKQKFDRLAAEDMEEAWLAAEAYFDRPEDWRGHLWEGDG